MRSVSLLLLTLCCCAGSFAQEKTERWGYLLDSVTHQPIPLASVRNLNTKTTVMTGTSGRFHIVVSENQALGFAAVGYHFDSVHFDHRFISSDTITLYLSPLAHDLGNVTVVGRGWTRYQADSMQRRRDYFGAVDYKIPAISQANSGAGIALNLDRFYKHERDKRKRFAFFDANENEEYINYRFPPALVEKYTGLKDEQLQLFMETYRPSAEWLRKNTHEEDVMYYINDKLKLFFKRDAPR